MNSSAVAIPPIFSELAGLIRYNPFYVGSMRHLGLILMLFLAFGVSAQECGVVYCSPTGSSNSAGTKADPTDLITGLSLANSTNPTLHLQQGSYVLNSALIVPNNIAIVGGYDADWNKSNGATTTIFRSEQNPQLGPPRLIAVEAIGKSGFRLQDLTIQTANALGEGVTTYGVYLNNSSDYLITRCKIITGNGGHGNSGSPGANGLSGADGLEGQPGAEDSGGNNAGGAAGSGSFSGSQAGGIGGNGGQRGTYEFPAGGETYPGDPGTPGVGLGGANGTGGLGIFTTIISISCDRTPANDGTPGEDGLDGFDGQFGIAGNATHGAGYYLPSAGTDGASGTHGSGGGGGGGGGSQGGIFWIYLPWPIEDTIPPNVNGSGAGGGGGGEGGQAGTGGSGGQGAGGSFAVYVFDNGFNGVLKDCELQAGNAGFGGAGGAGGAGGSGGSGGIGGGLQNCDVGAGGDGGNGGYGGNGGVGGAGSNGESDELYVAPGGEPLVLQNIYGLAQPLVTITNPGCIGSPVTFEVDGSGTAQWFFGSGADPYSQTGLSAVTSYTTQGLKTFTLVLNGVAYTYTDFLRVWQNALAPPPDIQTTTIQLCEGDGGAFTSSVASENYIWELSTDADTVLYEGANLQQLNTIVFDTAQTYQLTLRTESNCCGISFADTVIIEVDSIIPPQIAIQSDLTGAAVGCLNGDITFTAAAINVGPDPTYQWTINGNPAGADQPVFTVNTLIDGDGVNCTVTSSLGCATGIDAQASAITVSMIPPPFVECEIDSFYAGDPTHFVANLTNPGIPPYEYFWTFGDGTFGFGADVYHIYDDGGSYTVNLTLVDSAGCEAFCQSNIQVSSSLSVDFSIEGMSLDSFAGCAPFDIQFVNESQNGVSYFWDLGDGSSSTQFEPSHTYNVPGTYSVTLWAYSASGNDSSSVQNLIIIHPTPVASFIPMQINPSEGGDTVQFADNSLNATSWLWDFDDPTSGNNSSTISNPIHTFSSNGSFNVSLIVTNQFGCADSIIIPHSVSVGFNDLESHGFNIYPIPNQGEFWIEMQKPIEGRSRIELRDATGRIAISKPISSNRKRIEFDASSLVSGVYQLSIISEHFKATRPVVIGSLQAE